MLHGERAAADARSEHDISAAVKFALIHGDAAAGHQGPHILPGIVHGHRLLFHIVHVRNQRRQAAGMVGVTVGDENRKAAAAFQKSGLQQPGKDRFPTVKQKQAAVHGQPGACVAKLRPVRAAAAQKIQNHRISPFPPESRQDFVAYNVKAVGCKVNHKKRAKSALFGQERGCLLTKSARNFMMLLWCLHNFSSFAGEELWGKSRRVH